MEGFRPVRRDWRIHNYLHPFQCLTNCLAAILLLLGSGASASEIYNFYDGVREMGMGGAYVNTADDETALLTNPAGLGKLRDGMFTVLDPELSGNSDAVKVVGSKYSDALDPQALLGDLEAHPGMHFHSHAQIFPSLVFPNFGIGLHMKYRVDGEVDTANKNYLYNYTNDWALAMGYNFRFFSGILKIGVAGRIVDRSEVMQNNIDPTSTTLSLSTMLKEGVGVAGDAGIIIAAPIRFLPSIGATIHDIGNTSYTVSGGAFGHSGNGSPNETTQTIDAGIAIFPILSNGVRSSFTAEVHDIQTLSQETDQMRRVHAGIEINIDDFLFLRGGLNQRYWTGGVEFTTGHLQLQASSYGVEIGTAALPVEDRRYVGKLSFRF
jgi:hypothetical protein